MKLSSFIKELQNIEKSYKDIEILVEMEDPCSNDYKYLVPFVCVEFEDEDEKARAIISADD